MHRTSVWQCHRVPYRFPGTQGTTTLAGRSPANISGISAWAIRSAVLVAILVGGYLTFELGRMQAGYSIVDTTTQQQALREQIASLDGEIVMLREEIALQETHRDIDREAYKDVESSLADLQQKIQEQRDAIEFYRGIMSPSDGGRGLRVQDLRLSKGGDDRAYKVRLVLVQVLQHDRAVKGDVGFSLEGAQDGVAVSYSLEQLVPADEDSSWPFSFRYFQTFDRDLVLPDGFVPERINLEVRSRTKSISNIEQSFAWQTGQG